ncbi:unnamed protein product, partial [Mesorhabditis belari]|uniref:Uncharacterized protein n=1 Tax=Mesorhabditis belari TaxID=2138241 RepID=A0AAF3F849_9BILA
MKTVVGQVHTHVEDIFRLTDKGILDEKISFACRKGEVIKRIFVIFVGGLIVDKSSYIAAIIHGIELLKELFETQKYRNREILAV